ncbi:lysozyme inhibitor LprI family protein [Arthrospira platensis BEA 1257B]
MLDKIATAIFAAFLAFPGATNSEVAETHVAQGIQCNPKGSMMEMKKCADDDYRVADRKLNEVYQQLLPKVQGRGKTAPDCSTTRLDSIPRHEL